MKTAAWFLALALFIVVMSYSPLRAQTHEEYSCDKGYFLDRYLSVSDEGVQHIHWSHDIPGFSYNLSRKMRAGGGYMKGHKIRLGDLALWLDREIPEKGVWVYQGIGNSITQGEIMIFNEHTKIVAVLNISTMQLDAHQCQLINGN